jgi:hypothetical protein
MPKAGGEGEDMMGGGLEARLAALEARVSALEAGSSEDQGNMDKEDVLADGLSQEAAAVVNGEQPKVASEIPAMNDFGRNNMSAARKMAVMALRLK